LFSNTCIANFYKRKGCNVVGFNNFHDLLFN
jgi:hypothetical protein